MSFLAVEQGFGAARAQLLDEARKLMATEDAREGLLSFMERRPGRFQGK